MLKPPLVVRPISAEKTVKSPPVAMITPPPELSLIGPLVVRPIPAAEPMPTPVAELMPTSLPVKDAWKMRVITVYDDEREEIITYVSTYDMQRLSNKGKIKSNKAVKLY